MLNHYITGELSIQKMSLCACGEIFQQVILKILVKNFSLLAVAEVFGRTSQVVRKTSYKNCGIDQKGKLDVGCREYVVRCQETNSDFHC